MIAIVSVLVGMVLLCGLFGATMLYAFRGPDRMWKFTLHIGYAYTLVAFYLFYVLFHGSSPAALATALLPLFLGFAQYLWQRTKRGNKREIAPTPPRGIIAGNHAERIYPIATSLIIVLLAAWPYLLAGWGNFWLTGNYDVEDGLNGRDAYVRNLIYDARPSERWVLIADKTVYDFSKVTGNVETPKRPDNSYHEWYAGDNFRFQYSSLAFWSEVLASLHGMDVFLVQALLNLVLMTFGIFYLSREIFDLKAGASATAALCSTGGLFYLTTFFNGHEGSLIFGSLIPALMFAVMAERQNPRETTGRAVLAGLMGGAIVFAYPHPLAIIGLPIALNWFISHPTASSRWPRFRAYLSRNRWAYLALILVGVIVTGAVLYGLWGATAGYRLRQAGQYRAWGYSRDWLIAPLYLGLITPPIEGLRFAGSMLSRSGYLYLVLSSLVILAFLGIAFLRAAPGKNARFLKVFAICWFVEYLVFRFFIVDSYYLYKFLYTQQFIFIIGCVCYLFSIKAKVVHWAFVCLIFVNIGNDTRLAQTVYQRPFNQNPERYRALLNVDRQILAKSFVDLTGGDAIAIRQTLKAHGIDPIKDPREAEYFIVPAGRDSDIVSKQLTETIAHYEAFDIKKAPRANYLMVRTWNEPEQFPTDPLLGKTLFRWIGQGQQGSLGLYVIRPELTEGIRGKFLRIGLQKGPSAVGDIDISVSAADQKVLTRLTLTGGVHWIWIPAEQALTVKQPLLIRSMATGESLLPRDDRILLYRVFAVGWTSTVYDDTALAMLNRKGADIIKGDASPTSFSLLLGQGWEAFEQSDHEQFRWVGQSGDLVLKGGASDGRAQIAIDLEPGPSHGKAPFVLLVFDQSGELVFTGPAMTGRNTILLPLNYHRQLTSIYTLRTNSQNLPVPGERRLLNFRVFGISATSIP